MMTPKWKWSSMISHVNKRQWHLHYLRRFHNSNELYSQLYYSWKEFARNWLLLIATKNRKLLSPNVFLYSHKFWSDLAVLSPPDCVITHSEGFLIPNHSIFQSRFYFLNLSSSRVGNEFHYLVSPPDPISYIEALKQLRLEMYILPFYIDTSTMIWHLALYTDC